MLYMFKNLFNKGKCLLGFHQGEWQYELTNQCNQTQVCKRCQTESKRIEHVWGEWTYQSEDACDLLRVCSRCTETESCIEHNWGQPTYKYSDSCIQVQVCNRCRKEEIGATKHCWERWEYLDADDCTQVQVCVRCGDRSQHSRLVHDWGNGNTANFTTPPCVSVAIVPKCLLMLVKRERVSKQYRCKQSISLSPNYSQLTTGRKSDKFFIVNQHTLFSPITDKYFKFAFEQYPQDDTVQKPLKSMQLLLHSCQQIGIDTTIQKLISPTSETQSAQVTEMRQSCTPMVSVPSPSSQPQVQIDYSLVGHWRYTESMGGSGFSMVTDTHLVLDRDGQFVRYSRSASSMGSSQSPLESGQWKVIGGKLCFQYNDSSHSVHKYKVTSDRLFFPENSSQRLWQRV